MNKKFMSVVLLLKKNGKKRAIFLKKHNVFGAIGDNVQFTPWRIPSDPKSIYIGDNVMIAFGVLFINHDQFDSLYSHIQTGNHIDYYRKDIHIGSNVLIGANVIILPGKSIGDNVIIGAGAVVSRDIPCNSVAVGNPIRIICSFEEFVKRRKEQLKSSTI